MDFSFVVDALLDLNLAAGSATKAANFASLVVVFTRVKGGLVGRDLDVGNHQVVAIARSGVGT